MYVQPLIIVLFIGNNHTTLKANSEKIYCGTLIDNRK